jgi:Ser/Thr protein kinase RdoA (MazF antagonist)
MSDTHHGSDEPDAPATVCRRWFGGHPVEVGPLSSSGFSGSRVLRVRPAGNAATFVLKSFHAATSRDHAEWVHRLAGHLRACGITQVPELIPARDGDTVVEDACGTLWEICRLVPGVAVPQPDPRQAAAAGDLLGRLHRAAATLPGEWPRSGQSPGIRRRIEQARSLEATPWEVRRDAWRRDRGAARSDLVAAVERRFDAAIDMFAASGPRFFEQIARLPRDLLPVQPVLRDIWCDHVLYAGPSAAVVTGLVDLHAAGVDTPAADIARLLGSWGVSASCAYLSPAERHSAALQAYERIQPLGPEERRLIGVLHRTAVVFGLDNWFRWTLEEGRQFADASLVVARIDQLMQELQPALIGQG